MLSQPHTHSCASAHLSILTALWFCGFLNVTIPTMQNSCEVSMYDTNMSGSHFALLLRAFFVFFLPPLLPFSPIVSLSVPFFQIPLLPSPFSLPSLLAPLFLLLFLYPFLPSLCLPSSLSSLSSSLLNLPLCPLSKFLSPFQGCSAINYSKESSEVNNKLTGTILFCPFSSFPHLLSFFPSFAFFLSSPLHPSSPILYFLLFSTLYSLLPFSVTVVDIG